MEISFTVRRGGDDQPLTFSFLAPAVQAALRRGLQAAAQRAQQRQSGEPATGEGGTNLTAQNVFSAMPAAAPATDAATSSAASVASAAAAAGMAGPSPASAAATAAAAAATGMPQPDLTRMIERIHRLSGAVAGSIFRECTPCATHLPPPFLRAECCTEPPAVLAQRTSSLAPFSRARRAHLQRAIGPLSSSSARPRQKMGRDSAPSAWPICRRRRSRPKCLAVTAFTRIVFCSGSARTTLAPCAASRSRPPTPRGRRPSAPSCRIGTSGCAQNRRRRRPLRGHRLLRWWGPRRRLRLGLRLPLLRREPAPRRSTQAAAVPCRRRPEALVAHRLVLARRRQEHTRERGPRAASVVSVAGGLDRLRRSCRACRSPSSSGD